MDPWEAVKWVAIFRLILPRALFRLCGGRVENLGELQPLAVKAGINGVMMGNFLTTLGSTPDEDREMFTDLGLTSRASPTTAPTRDLTTAAAGWRARRPTSSRRSSTRPKRPRRPASRSASGIPRSSCASPRRSPSRPDRTARPTAGRRRPPDGHPGAPRRDRRTRAHPADAPGERPTGPAGRPGRKAGPAAVLEQLPRA